MHLALTDLFKARWTQDIHNEWINSLLSKRKDLSREKLERTSMLMNSSVPDSLVIDYKPIIPSW